MTAMVQFEVAYYPDGIPPICYMLSYDSNMNVLSSNYYGDATADRGDSANLIVENGSVIVCVVSDLNSTPTKYYTTQPIIVSDITLLPNGGIIGLNFLKPTSHPIKAYDLSSVGAIYVPNNESMVATIPLYVMYDITKVTLLVTNDNFTKCTYNRIIMGDMGTVLQAQGLGQFYGRDNICIPRKIPETYFTLASTGQIMYGSTVQQWKDAYANGIQISNATALKNKIMNFINSRKLNSGSQTPPPPPPDTGSDTGDTGSGDGTDTGSDDTGDTGSDDGTGQAPHTLHAPFTKPTTKPTFKPTTTTQSSHMILIVIILIILIAIVIAVVYYVHKHNKNNAGY